MGLDYDTYVMICQWNVFYWYFKQYCDGWECILCAMTWGDGTGVHNTVVVLRKINMPAWWLWHDYTCNHRLRRDYIWSLQFHTWGRLNVFLWNIGCIAIVILARRSQILRIRTYLAAVGSFSQPYPSASISANNACAEQPPTCSWCENTHQK